MNVEEGETSVDLIEHIQPGKNGVNSSFGFSVEKLETTDAQDKNFGPHDKISYRYDVPS